MEYFLAFYLGRKRGWHKVCGYIVGMDEVMGAGRANVATGWDES